MGVPPSVLPMHSESVKHCTHTDRSISQIGEMSVPEHVLFEVHGQRHCFVSESHLPV